MGGAHSSTIPRVNPIRQLTINYLLGTVTTKEFKALPKPIQAGVRAYMQDHPEVYDHVKNLIDMEIAGLAREEWHSRNRKRESELRRVNYESDERLS
jgi:hypothetical protein